MAAPPPPKGWKVEYAKSGRASCKTCSNSIPKDSLRIAKVVQSYQFDGLMTIWHHMKCIQKKPRQIASLIDIEGVDDIRWDDQQKLRKYVEGGGSIKEMKDDDDPGVPTTGEYAIENAKSSRAACKSCNEKIMKNEVRISTMVESGSERYRGKVPAWRHAKCFLELGWWTHPVKKLPGWDSLGTDDQDALQTLAKSLNPDCKTEGKGSKRKVAAMEETAAVKQKEAGSASKPTEKEKGKAGNETAKRRKNEDDSPPVITDKKTRRKGTEEENIPAEKKRKGIMEKEQGAVSLQVPKKKSSGFDEKLEQQTKAIWALKDELKKNVTTSELRSMLVANLMDVSGTELELRDRCVDGMMFGALGICPMCSSPVEYRGGLYKCKGFLTAWSKCTYTTSAPDRKAGKWKLPADIDNDFLVQWIKKQKSKKDGRLSVAHDPVQIDAKKEQEVASPKILSMGPLGGLSVTIAGRLAQSQAAWKKMIEDAGGVYHTSIVADTKCVVTTDKEIERQKERLQNAQSLGIPIVTEQYLLDCIEKQKRLPFQAYAVEVGSKLPAMVKVKVKGRSAVHEESGLQDTGHILEVEKVIYNVTLNMSDLSTGINSYYILQIIEDDRKAECHLFRKWGRVGNNRIGNKKLERLGKAKAINEFRRLLTEKTGNHWKAWESKEELEKQPGKFYLVDIDYGVSEEAPTRGLVAVGSKSKLDPRVINLMRMLFDIETYRAAMMEFEINMTEMPLGKLSKRHIERGFQVLCEIQDFIELHDKKPEKEGKLIDASNRFFTLIPSVQPDVIRDKTMLKAKIDMLETLRDIEIASSLIGSVGDSDEDPLDVNYQKLHCGISPLSHDSDDYKLVAKYLERTHAPTHKDWQLELEDVFEVDRKGEYDAYAPNKKNLENRMLLWHGSRTTNYVGILSQGLRIAPPEAPVTGYMFGKGLYFADLVSKSAQYCYTTKQSPTGLMLLCEVALGKVKEFKGAKYMDKPMSGSNSTKGIGKTVPLESEFETWDDNVTVPCGRPTPAGPSDSSLLYNEYIVYDTSQVHLRFLLKVKFKHKR